MRIASIIWLYIGSVGLCLHCRPDCMPAFETKKAPAFGEVRGGVKRLAKCAYYRGIARNWANIRYNAKKPARINGRAFWLAGLVVKFVL